LFIAFNIILYDLIYSINDVYYNINIIFIININISIYNSIIRLIIDLLILN